MKRITTEKLRQLAGELAKDYDLYGPKQADDGLGLAPLPVNGQPPEIAWNDLRLAESLKPLWFQSARVLSRWTADGPEAGPPVRPRAVFGVKACDLVAIEVLDKVFRDHEFQEPAWCASREKHLIIAGDCTDAGDSCFCTMLGNLPYPKGGFDLLLSPIEKGFIVEIGSEKGEAVVRRHATLFDETLPSQLTERDQTRHEVEAKVRQANLAWPTKDPFTITVEKNLKTRIWERLAATCVECNACNTVCPTCHCFLLYDRKTEEGAVRISQWDSCFQAGYARMAGGGTPRLQLTERFKNHYSHKFVSFPKNWGVTACSGCGRCIDACMGRIDKRKCLHRLEVEWMPSEVLDDFE